MSQQQAKSRPPYMPPHSPRIDQQSRAQESPTREQRKQRDQPKLKG